MVDRLNKYLERAFRLLHHQYYKTNIYNYYSRCWSGALS